MAGTYLIQVSNQTGAPAAVSYGCKKYRVSQETRVDKLVDPVVKDHGLPDDSDGSKVVDAGLFSIDANRLVPASAVEGQHMLNVDFDL